MKQSGILLHISSLNTDYGIGDLGSEAYAFADYLAQNGYSFWQILPLNHPGYGNSPYNPISAFVGNPYLISPELLIQDGLLKEDEAIRLPKGWKIDFESVYKAKDAMLKLAANRYLERYNIDEYIEEKAYYIKAYTAFLFLTESYGHSNWQIWDKAHKSYNDELFADIIKEPRAREIAAIQAIFDDQLRRLKEHVTSQGIKIIGDVPLYLSYESAEVWAFQELFDLNDEGRRQSFAGVPPDAFSDEGQLWGNPIYLWEKMEKDGFELFMRRFAVALDFVDLLRLDHFIGYVNYWKVPLKDGEAPVDAIEGSWVKARPKAFFEELNKRFSKERFIAEDLGILNDEVCHYRDKYSFPGMIVLQFCFDDGVQDISRFPKNRIIYTGTHDNNTSLGWFRSLLEESLTRRNLEQFCKRYLPEAELPTEDNIHEIMADIARLSGCKTMILPMQDLLGLDERHRMNTPGTPTGNWDWRLNISAKDIAEHSKAQKMRQKASI